MYIFQQVHNCCILMLCPHSYSRLTVVSYMFRKRLLMLGYPSYQSKMLAIHVSADHRVHIKFHINIPTMCIID